MHISRNLFKYESFSQDIVSLLKNRTNPLILAHLSAIEHLKNTDVFFDTALRTADDVKQAINLVGSKRILFGSDFPVTDINKELSKLDVLKTVVKEQIIDKNAGNILQQVN